MSLHLVRHGMPLLDPAVRSTDWPLDPVHLGDVKALRSSLPPQALWFSSPELKARQTAELLTDAPVTIVSDLREQVRSGWFDDLRSVIDRAFAEPSQPAHEGWETLDECRNRIASALTRIRGNHPHDDLVLVGHGTAWTMLVAELTDTEPDLAALRAMAFPDIIHL